MSDQNPSVAAVMAEIETRMKELDALRAALRVLQDNRPRKFEVVMNNGMTAVTQTYDPAELIPAGTLGDNGNATIATFAPPSPLDITQSKRNRARETTSRVLDAFDRKEMRTLEEAAERSHVPTRNVAVGVLIRHGYLKRKGLGFLRTAKPYTP